MFEVTVPAVDQRLFKIEKEYEVLHYDEEPILFTGLTAFNYRVVGSLVEEDQDADTKRWFSRFFYKIVDSSTYVDFLNRKISYLDLIKRNTLLFIFDEFYQGPNRAFCLDWQDVPEEYLPTTESFCPTLVKAKALQYLVSLQGKLADTYLALSSDLNHVQTAFTGLLQNIVKVLSPCGFELEVYQAPSTTGSFQLNFHAKLKNQQSSLFTNEQDMITVYNQFVQYCLEHLPQEAESIFNTEEPNPEHYDRLKGQLEAFYKESHIEFNEQTEAKLKPVFESALNNIEEMTKQIGENYSEIGVFNKTTYSNSIEMAHLTIEDRQKIEETVIKVESIGSTKDQSPTTYKIHVYSLNTDTRKGSAILRDDATVISKPKIKILGNHTLETSSFTESLHLNTYIEVTGVGSWKNGRCVHIDIDFE